MNKKIGFTALRKGMSRIVSRWGDHRAQNKIQLELHDVIMSAFACMFYQEPSLLQFQKDLENIVHENNLHTQFGVTAIPSSTQMKTVTDEVNSNKFASIFNMLHNKLDVIDAITTFKNKLGTYFNSVDGTQYFTSTKIHCKKCLTKEHKDGTHYSHEMLQSAIVLPGKNIVIPLMPVAINNEPDVSYSKQDCERKAFFRFLSNLESSYLQLPFTFTLDALYADQVVVKAIREHKHNFIIVAKPDDTKYLHEEFSLITTKTNTFEYVDGKYLHCYQWSNSLPLTSQRKVLVNFVKYEQKTLVLPGEYKAVYKNSWVTSHEITGDNVADIVRGGRVKWKIENECFNTQKNQGYNLEHSYGHGENNLSFNFAVLTVLAFFFHQIFEYKDEFYQACRKKCGSKMNLWGTLKTLVSYMVFESFEKLLDFMLNRDDYIDHNGLVFRNNLPRYGPGVLA